MSAASYWEEALPYREYLEQMTERREEYEKNFADTKIDPAVREAFEGRVLRFLIITEDWCGDSPQFVAPIARLADELENMHIRFLLRPDVLELADRYRDASGRQPIPVIIVLDDTGNELGVLLERPKAATEQMAAETRRFASANSHLEGIRRAYRHMPDETRAAVAANIRAWRAGKQEEFTEQLFEELIALIKSHAPA